MSCALWRRRSVGVPYTLNPEGLCALVGQSSGLFFTRGHYRASCMISWWAQHTRAREDDPPHCPPLTLRAMTSLTGGGRRGWASATTSWGCCAMRRASSRALSRTRR